MDIVVQQSSGTVHYACPYLDMAKQSGEGRRDKTEKGKLVSTYRGAETVQSLQQKLLTILTREKWGHAEKRPTRSKDWQ